MDSKPFLLEDFKNVMEMELKDAYFGVNKNPGMWKVFKKLIEKECVYYNERQDRYRVQAGLNW